MKSCKWCNDYKESKDSIKIINAQLISFEWTAYIATEHSAADMENIRQYTEAEFSFVCVMLMHPICAQKNLG